MPSATSSLDHLPQAQPAARVEARRRLVEEQHRRLGDQRRGEIEPPPHPARVGLRRRAAPRRRGRSARAARSPRRLRRASAARRTAARPSSGSRGRSGSRRPPRTGRPARSARAAAPRRATTSRPTTRARPRVGLEQRRQDPHERRLAGAVRAEQTEHRPGGTSRSTPSSARTCPNDFDSPLTLIAASPSPWARDRARHMSTTDATPPTVRKELRGAGLSVAQRGRRHGRSSSRAGPPRLCPDTRAFRRSGRPPLGDLRDSRWTGVWTCFQLPAVLTTPANRASPSQAPASPPAVTSTRSQSQRSSSQRSAAERCC